MKNKIFKCVGIVLFAFNFNTQAQKPEYIDRIKSLPLIEYGQLPYWSGNIEKSYKMLHGFYSRESINKYYNNIIESSLNDTSICYKINLGIKQYYTKVRLLFPDETGCFESTFKTNNENTIEGQFCPSIYASAHSVAFNKYHVVYFWRATFTESIFYFALVFDNEGNLISAFDFDFWHVNFPFYPFNSAGNRIREIESSEERVSFLPNNLILSKIPDQMQGGGIYSISRLNEDGHFATLKKWRERGEVDEDLTKNDKYVNLIRVNVEDGSKQLSLIPFIVQDPDGYSNIRASDNTSSEIIRKINNSDVVFGTFLQNGWCKIDFTAETDGSIKEGGYIHVSRLKKLSKDWGEFIIMPSEIEWKNKNGIK